MPSSSMFLLRRKQAWRFLSFLVAAIVVLFLGLSYRQLFHFHVQQQQQQQQQRQQQRQEPPLHDYYHVGVQPKQQHVRTSSSRLVVVPQRDDDNNKNNKDGIIDDKIRSWGCTRRRETPLIFIHVGKMGGGTIRARLAAAALGYNRTHWHNSSDASAYYYPVGRTRRGGRRGGKDKDNARGYFCNSAWHQFRYWQSNRTFEGTMACHATTPVGQAIACPEPIRDGYKCMACSPYDNSSSCHVIYAGHNLLGNELHHLPPQYLIDWWKSTWDSTTTITTNTTSSSDTTNAVSSSSSSSSSLTEFWQLLQINNPSWCPALQQGRPQTFRQANRNFQACAVPLGQTVDAVALEWVQKHPVMQRLYHRHNDKKEGEHDTMLHLGETFHHLDINLGINWGPLYASLPVVRTIVVREPFSWLLSKFAWHGHARWYTCDNVTAATHRWYVAATDDNDDAMSIAMVETKARGWAHAHAVYYLLQVCGEDCQIKWEQAVTHLAHNLTVAQESALLASFERQADYNLRHAFGVVGLQDDIDGFYDMLTARVRYLNMSSSSNVVEGPRHASHPTETCRNVYGDEAFRQSMMEASPAIAAIVRLHQTARRVHAFQKKEMEMCAQ